MPKRLRIQKFLSTKVQGDDSWVRVSPLTVAEMRAARERRQTADQALKDWLKAAKLAEEEKQEAPERPEPLNFFEIGLTVLKEHVIEWNWVDDDGNPLPQMPEHPEVVELLTDTEVAFLGECIQGSEEAAKN